MPGKRLTVTIIISAFFHLALFTAWWHGQRVITMSTTPIGSPLQIAINQTQVSKPAQVKPVSRLERDKEIKQTAVSQNKVAAVNELNQPIPRQNNPEQDVKSVAQDPNEQTKQNQEFELARLNNNMVDYLSSEFKLRFKYPMLARKRGWQGEVLLGLDINQHGKISHVAIQRSSGYKVLDRNAVKTFELIGAVSPRLKTELMNNHHLLIPVVYKLTGS